MRHWKAIIFDMDGTLFDTETISMKAWKRVGETLQLPTSDELICSFIVNNKNERQWNNPLSHFSCYSIQRKVKIQ